MSHVLNATASISETTKKRVEAAILKLNYTPNALARGLRGDRRNLIGIIVPDITNEFYSKFVATLLAELAKQNISAIIISTDYSYEREQNGIQSLLMTRVDGMIFLGGSQDEDLIDLVAQNNIAVVLADRRYKHYSSVEFNNQKVMFKLMGDLKKRGYRNVGYISESTIMINLKDRYEGLLAGVTANELELQKDWIFDESWLRLDKINATSKIINHAIDKVQNHAGESLPDVLVASSDMIAVSVIDTLISRGYKIPEQIAVIGYDDTIIGKYYQPNLTSIRQDYQLAAAKVLEILDKKLHNHNKEEHIVLENKIIYRNTTR